MKCLSLLMIILLVGCSSPVIDFEPSNPMLPGAKVGELYIQTIRIGYDVEDEPEFLNAENTHIVIHPDDTGLVVIPSGINKNWGYNKLIIKGVPAKVADVSINISGFTHPGMYEKSISFKQIYTIKIQ